jgi:transcriptional regulator with XRE-family HTH domain
MFMSIGVLIREIRLAKGIGLNELAGTVKMDAANLSRFERGGSGIKLPESLYPIAEALETSVPALFLLLEKSSKDKTLLKDRGKLVRYFERINAALAEI